MRPPIGPGSGPDWDGSPPRLGLLHGFLYNLCTSISSCFSVFCCCWLVQDCLMGRRYRQDGPPFPVGPGYGGPMGSLSGPPDQPPPPPPPVGPGHRGFFGSLFGQSVQPGPVGYPGIGEPPRF